MLCKNPNREDNSQNSRLQLESFGRFANYYYAMGWHSGTELPRECFIYSFEKPTMEASPEFSFYVPEHQANRKSSDPHRFLHLFWINDGYLAHIDQDSPVILTIRCPENGEILTFAEFCALRDYDTVAFIDTLAQIRIDDVWSNRVVLEMVAGFTIPQQQMFFIKAAEHCGWQPTLAMMEKYAQGTSAATSESLRLGLHADWLQKSKVVYMQPALKQTLASILSEINMEEIDVDTVARSIEQMSRYDPTGAYRFVSGLILSQGLDREKLSKVIRYCLPRHSQWWISHLFACDGLGTEQVADALISCGTCAAGEGRVDLARLCHQAALCVCPEDQNAAWSLGCLHLSEGDVDGAQQAFAKVKRYYPELSISTPWPVIGGQTWPHTGLRPDMFTLPEGVTSWPKISIVTPSFNQGIYVEETILSVLNQNYPNLQYIVVDGNSTDQTRGILENYRGRIDHLIIEPDNGQTEAINKGFRLADGEIIAWLNSDDVYAPGALHVAALAWLANKADVIAGICLEHTDHCFQLVNKPAARNADFNVPQLARIFQYWLKGHYFYQPEVFFSKRILDAVGLLNESLYYSMDYDLWMRFVKAGASLEVIDWPVAFFRKHETQKTSNLIDCVEEQALVRSSHYNLSPNEERSSEIIGRLGKLRENQRVKVGILTKRLGKIFSTTTQRELDEFVNGRFQCFLSDDEENPKILEADVIIYLVHILDDITVINKLRAANPDLCIIGWFWDNHHHLFENHAVAEALDVVIPGHALYSEYLRNDQSILADHVPLCVTQWTRQDVAQWFPQYDGPSRKPNLYGGFVDYHFEPARTEFLHNVMASVPNHALRILSEDNLKDYFGRSEEERFAEWCGYQTSLVLPLRNDLSQRVFDALLAGQIPLVPEEIKDLDTVIPRDLQDSLPIIRFSMKKPESCLEAYNKANALAARDGHIGCARRHEYALTNAMFSNRVTWVIENALLLGENHPAFPI